MKNVAPSFLRRLAPVWVAGALGVLSLLLQPLPNLDELSSQSGLPSDTLRFVVLLNPLLLATAMAALGAATAHRIGLVSVLAGTAGDRSPQYGRSVVMGLALGLLMAALDRAWAPFLGGEWERFHRQANESAGASTLLMAICYGGITEEVMMRWGLMSAVACLLAIVLRKGAAPGAGVIVTAAMAAALVFAAGHLPVLSQSLTLTPGVVARTLVLNAMAGLVYGWLYWRRTLESAMAAHAATHLGLTAVRLLL